MTKRLGPEVFSDIVEINLTQSKGPIPLFWVLLCIIKIIESFINYNNY